MKAGRWLRRVSILDYISLTKPRIVLMTVLTAGWAMALPGRSVSALSAVMALLGTGLCVGSANAINQYMERDVDGLMARTRLRPLPAGRLRPGPALGFGVALGLSSLVVLGWGANLLTAALGGAALLIYVLAYTPLKRKSAWALWLGAVAGAMPPLLGWTAVTGRLGLGGVLIAATLWVWQIPHFIAISLFRKDDYARAGLQTVPLAWGNDVALAYTRASCVVLLGVSLLLPLLGQAGLAYTLFALPSGAALALLSLRSWRQEPIAAWSRKLFAATLVYLPVLALGTLVDVVTR